MVPKHDALIFVMDAGMSNSIDWQNLTRQIHMHNVKQQDIFGGEGAEREIER